MIEEEGEEGEGEGGMGGMPGTTRLHGLRATDVQPHTFIYRLHIGYGYGEEGYPEEDYGPEEQEMYTEKFKQVQSIVTCPFQNRHTRACLCGCVLLFIVWHCSCSK